MDECKPLSMGGTRALRQSTDYLGRPRARQSPASFTKAGCCIPLSPLLPSLSSLLSPLPSLPSPLSSLLSALSSSFSPETRVLLERRRLVYSALETHIRLTALSFASLGSRAVK